MTKMAVDKKIIMRLEEFTESMESGESVPGANVRKTEIFSVDYRLPEVGKRVLLFEGYDWSFGCLIDRPYWKSEKHGMLYDPEVTHWMEIPPKAQ